MSSKTMVFICFIYPFRCNTVKELLQHQNDAHGRSFRIQHREMDSEKEFEKWKIDIQAENNCLYVKDVGAQTRKYHRTSYYYCNRSGFYEARGSGQRGLKSQGSSKLQAHCCAFITKKVEKGTGRVSVEYCDNHTHGTKFSHLRMSEETRSFNAGKLASGVDSKKLLREIREKINTLNGRGSILVHKDILNIKHQYNIHEAARDKNDLKSTSIWVEELRAQEYDPILIFKPTECEEYGPGSE